MPKLAVAILAVASIAGSGAGAAELIAGADEAAQAIVIRGQGGEVLASVPLHGERFAVSYRNSIYGTVAEERYAALPDGRFRLVEIAADQLAVLEEYYSLPGAPRHAPDRDRREWVVPPDPERPTVLGTVSMAATELGERTLHVPGEPPLELWPLVADAVPFVVLEVEEKR